jgi:hypothetical protein
MNADDAGIGAGSIPRWTGSECRFRPHIAWKALSGPQLSLSKSTGSTCAAGVTPGAFGIGCAANLSCPLPLARFRLYIAWKALRACKFPDRYGHAASDVEEGAFRSHS